MVPPLRAGSGFDALVPRLLTAAAGVPVFLVALFLGGTWWIAVVAAVTIIGALEFVRLHPALAWAARTLVIAGAVGTAFVIAWAPEETLVSWVLAVAGGIVVGAGALRAFLNGIPAPPTKVRPPWATVALGIAYLGTPGGVLVRWRLALGFQVVAVLFAIVWANDVAGYFVGSRIGKHKLAPGISPGKSWEGAVAGLVTAGVLGAGLGPLVGLPAIAGAFFGVTTSAISQVGDLFQSALKRTAGVKDSGTILPGHGGVLDRFDGILFAAPLGYVLVRAWTA